MKLPEFRSAADQTSASRSTSMSSAFMTPQLRPMTERHKAVTHNTNIRPYNPQLEAQAAMAKYQVADTVIAGLGSMAEMYGKIDDSAQLMATEKAAAEYKYGMMEFTAQEIMTGGEIDPETGMQRHYGYEERYAAKKEELIASVTGSNKFSKPEYMHKFELNVQGVDYVNTDDLRSSGQKHKIEKGKGDYLAAISATNDTAKRIELTDLAVEAGFITDAKGEENKHKYRVEGSFNDRSTLIDSDMVGRDTQVLISRMKTDEGILSVGGKENADKLIQKGVEHLGLIYADNAFGDMSVTGSKETLKRKLADYSNMTPEQLGVDTLEEKDLLLNIMESKFKDATRVMEKDSEVSESKRQLQISFGKFQDNTEWAAEGVKPVQGAYNKERQKHYSDYIEIAQQNGAKLEEMVAHPKNYEIEKFTWIDDGVYPEDILIANKRQLDHKEPAERYRGAVQINRFLNDPDIPKFLQDKALKTIGGEENAGYAAAIAGTNGSPELLESMKEAREKPINRADGEANWVAWSNKKEWDAAKTFTEKLTDAGFNTPYLPPDAINALEGYTRDVVVKGKYGNGSESFNASQDDAVGQFLVEWGQEMRGDQLTWVRGSFSKQSGGDTEAQQRVISDRLVAGGYTDVLLESTFAQQSPGDPNLYYLRLNREDGSVQTLYDKANPNQAMTVDASELRNTGIEVRNERLSGQRGADFMNVVEGDNPVIEGTGIPEWFKESGLQDWFVRDFKASVQTVKEATKMIFGITQSEAVSNNIKEFAARMVGISPELAQNAPIDYLQNQLKSGIFGFEMKPENKEANDIIWTRMMKYYSEGAVVSNNKKKKWSKDQIDEGLINTESRLMEYGLERP